MKIGIIHFCGIQINKRHLFDNHLQIAKDENPRFFNCLNKILPNNNSAPNNVSVYLLNNLETKEHWDQIIKELNNFAANNDIMIVINQNNAKYLPSCLGNSFFNKLKTFKSEWYSGFAIRHNYEDYFKQRFSEITEKKN